MPSRPRHRMLPENRRAAITDAATVLFSTRAWDTVTITDIIAATGISKGGFYHHFPSKEDLLVAVVLRIVEEGLDEAAAAPAAVAGRDATARLAAFLETAAEWQLRRASDLKAFAEIAARPENDIVFQRLFHETSQAALPLLRGHIESGIAEGCFDVADIGLTAEILLGLARERQATFFDALAAIRAGDLERGTGLITDRMRRESATCERLLGLRPGTMPLSRPVLDRARALRPDGAQPA